jgi:two-component sensor histidine kinase
LVVGFIALLAIVGTTFWLNQRSQSSFERAIVARNIGAAASGLRHAIQTAETSQRGYIVTGNQIYLAPYRTAKTLAVQKLDELDKTLNGLPGAGPPLDRLKVVTAQKIAEMDESVTLKRDRLDNAALAVLRTNRGKALMDEANVFLASFVRNADERLTEELREQKQNAAVLRIVSIIGGTLIVLVVGIVFWTVIGYARNLRRARDEVAAMNSALEVRVAERTDELRRARDRAEVLLSEVNHRVANSLSLVASMVNLQTKATNNAVAKDLLAETQARIEAVATLHKRLYTSGDVREVALDEYLSGLLKNIETYMRAEGHRASLRHELEPLSLSTDKSINLGVVATEWVTNAFKYAYPGKPGEIRIKLREAIGGGIELLVEDDGVGRDVSEKPVGTGLGTRIVHAMAHSMGAQVEYLARRPGTAARLLVVNG